MKVIMIVTWSILNIVTVVLMNEWRWWWKECSGVAQEDKIFRAVSSLLLLDKFSCVEDDRTEGRAHLTRRLLLLLLLQHHFIIFWAYFHISEFSQKVVLVVWKVLSSVACFSSLFALLFLLSVKFSLLLLKMTQKVSYFEKHRKTIFCRCQRCESYSANF